MPLVAADGEGVHCHVLMIILGVVGSELRDKQWSKILSLAPMHV